MSEEPLWKKYLTESEEEQEIEEEIERLGAEIKKFEEELERTEEEPEEPIEEPRSRRLRIWRVVLEGESLGRSDDVRLKFIDVEDIFDGYPQIEEDFINGLLENVDYYGHYKAYENIKKVLDPDNEPFPISNLYIVLGEHGRGMKYGILIWHAERDMKGIKKGFYLLAVHPRKAYRVIRESKNRFEKILTSLLTEPDEWDSVSVIG